MANLRPLGRQAKKANRSDSEILLLSRNSHQSWSWPLGTHCAFRKPSRAAMATTCTPSTASLITTISRSRFTNFVCHGSRIRDHGGSSLSALPPNQPVISHFATHARGNICNLHCRRYEAPGSKANTAVACSSQCRCCGRSAAGPLGSPSIRASCSSHGHDVMAPIRQAGGTPLTYSQLQPSHAATAASAQLVRRRSLATASASAPEAPASEGSPQPLRSGDLDELLYTSGGEAPYYRGPLELREVPDSGVGVFVTEDVPCGTLLLACYPLALLRGRPTGHSTHAPAAPALLPSPMELAHALDGAIMSPLAAAWMLGLYDGVDDDEDDGDVSDGGSGEGDGGRKRRRLAQLRQLFRQPFDATSAAAPDADEGEEELGFRDAAGVAAKGVRCPLPAEAVARVVTFNAYGEARPDPAVAAVKSLSGEHLSGCVGLWPPFSLINHSCAPVASYGLVGDVMVVRAATDLSAGQQVTISYFGRRALAPLELRRAYLAQHYGFICSCERCTLEAAGLEEEDQQAGEGDGYGRLRGEGRNGAGAGTARLPPELPAFLENLHTTCSRAAAPHLNDMLTGRRWMAAAGGGGGTGVNGAVRRDEPVSELVEELSELYNYLSGCWQQLLRAAAAAAATSGTVAEGEEEEGVEDAAATGGGGLSQQEVFWLEGSVFVLLDQLLVVLGTLGLLKRVEEQHQRTAAKSMASGEAGGGRKGALAAAAKGGSVRRVAASPGGKAAGRAEVDGVVVVADESGSAAAAPPLTALAAMRAVASRRWRVEELTRNFLMPYVDLLAQAQEVAAAVAPGSDLAVACAVRLLYGIQAVLGPESDEFREAEISCYDALSARYGILDYDVYEQILEVCVKQYGAQEVRLPGLAGEAVPAAAPQPPAAFLLDGGAGEGGMVGLHIPAVPVDAEVVEE
ncbi:hypothetical protein Vretifemale_4251 [Volvox reticuliferus]|uniref:SET domain-containing protein n=1 Tax=Volvox reticuliferus TaxID=1737510 RepID=A0A8J4C455_9CHLO|nr:hypothetical protein Vretifemale_4251 [Volvox reticuliferus]